MRQSIALAMSHHNLERIMSAFVRWSMSAIVLALLAGADEKAQVEKAPDAVTATIKARFPDAEITSVEKYTEDDEVYYDVELKQKDQKYELDLQADGTLLEIDKDIPAKDVPEACAKAIEAKYPKATVTSAQAVSIVDDKNETLTRYDVSIALPDKTTRDLEVAVDGSSVEEQ